MNKILIIDDDRELCALIKRSVQAENIEADFCNTGKEGLQKLKEQEYQLVVLDVMMPGMDGFETLEEIRIMTPEGIMDVLDTDQRLTDAEKLAIANYWSQPLKAELLINSTDTTY